MTITMNIGNIRKATVLGLFAFAATTSVQAQSAVTQKEFGQEYIDAISVATPYVSKRPAVEERLFRSKVIEQCIKDVKKKLKDTPYLAWMFENCFPNTLDTTVHYKEDANGNPDTFVYTGDIHAMWGRDSGAQVWPYLQFAKKDKNIQKMIKGVILRQFKNIQYDPYANGFLRDMTEWSKWKSDDCGMKPGVYERKYEIDSLCYPLRLAYEYWRVTGDASIFEGKLWQDVVKNILSTFREQQRKDGPGSYRFLRVTDRQLDTVCNVGLGAPVRPVGLIASVFRPSDDATTFLFLVPANFMAVSTLNKMADVLNKVNSDCCLAAECTSLATEVKDALQKYAVYNHPKYGKIYAFEVDGMGNQLLMDDANVPSLLAMPYLGDVPADDPIYLNTRKYVWSKDNPYFFSGKAGEGIGGPHVGYDMAWPMTLIMRAMTSNDDQEIKQCVQMLMDTDANTGVIHESFDVKDSMHYSRPWFAWQNTLFGELILKLVNEGKTDLLNSCKK